MSQVAIITARGGSKRIPRKNIRPFLGRPIIAYVIEAALSAGLFDEVMVSTDDGEIAEMAKNLGAMVPFMRGSKASDDFATTSDVLLDVLSAYRDYGRSFSRMACIYPTAPFVTAEKLACGMEMLSIEGCHTVLPVTRYSHPPQRALFLQSGELRYRWPENRSVRSQDLEPLYYDCGQFYCYDVACFLACSGIITEGTFPLFLPEDEVQDIDTETDWRLAEIKYTRMLERGGDYA